MTYLLIWAHFAADFVFQSDKMAQGKSSSNKWLLIHGTTYTSILLIHVFGFLKVNPMGCLKYAGLNGLIHVCVDYCTSRMTKSLWQQKRVHDFFVIIGFDQAIHMSFLLGTTWILK